jgi:hypothetical protein
MVRVDPSTVELLVFTFKDGLFSAVAHDLKIEVTQFSIERSDSEVRLIVDPTSLHVMCARKNGADDPKAVSSTSKSEIEKNIVHEVLEAKRYPELKFETTDVTATEVNGRLTLHGVTKDVSGRRVDDATHLGAEFRVDQRTFGMKPFTAMLGTLRVMPEVIVRIRLPRSAVTAP